MSYFDAKELREKRFAVVQRAQEISKKWKDENRIGTADERTEVNKLLDEEKQLKEQIDSAEKAEQVDNLVVSGTQLRNYTPSKAKRPSKKDYELSFRAWVCEQIGERSAIKSEWQDAAERCNFNYQDSALRIDRVEERDDTTPITNETYGEAGATIAGVISIRKRIGPVQQACQVVTSADARPLHWVTNDDTANTSAAHTDLATVNSTGMTLGRAIFGGFDHATACYKVPLSTVRDTSIPLLPLISDNLSRRISRKENLWATTGAGTTEPSGCSTLEPTYFYKNDGTVDYYTLLTYLEQGVDTDYQNEPKSAFMFSNSHFTAMKLLVDEQSRPLWVPSLLVGAPDKLLGHPYYVNPDLPALTATTTSNIIFGDWSNYLVRLVGPVQLTVLRERWAEQLCVGFIAHGCIDAGYLTTSAFCGAASGTSGSYLIA